MKIRSQVGMVLNLDKCIGCHTCSITCKNVWTSREGMEYAWFNNVETKPGIGYPKEWENQDKWNGGWVRKANGDIEPRIGGKLRVLANIFANPDLPADRRLLRAVRFRLPASAHRARAGRSPADGTPALAGQRRAHGKNTTGGPTGRRFWAPSSKSEVKTKTSTTCRNRCTASSKTPS